MTTSKTRRGDSRKRLVEAIVVLHADFGFPPTRRELAHEVSISYVRVAQLLEQLRDEGVVVWDKGRSRSIRLVRGWEA
jgi:SOS-response transcriptional repressor LexA